MEIGKKVESTVLSSNSNKKTVRSKEKSEESDFEKLLLDLDKKQSNSNSDNSESLDREDMLNSFNPGSGNVYDGQTTDRGTKIVAPGSDMDKNAFLKILATQMSNQDPTQSQDGTEYISQFAQFASMEQMSNLNNTMSQFASQSLIGKGVMLNAYDNNGRPITGIVKSVNQQGSNILVGVEYLDENGSVAMGEFKKGDVTSVVEANSNNLEYINNNMSMLVASSMINKDVEFVVESDNKSENSTPIYEKLNGVVESVIIENNMVKLNIREEDTNEINSVTLDKISKVEGKEYANKF